MVYHAYKFGKILSLKNLKKERVKEEENRQKILKDEVLLLLDGVEQAIDRRNSKEAKSILDKIRIKIDQVKDRAIHQKYQQIQECYTQLIAELKKEEERKRKEIEKKEREKQERLELMRKEWQKDLKQSAQDKPQIEEAGDIQQTIYVVKYQLSYNEEREEYCFYTSPQKDALVYPYRRKKVEHRGYTELPFERALRSCFTDTNYQIIGDISIHLSEDSHPYEPDIAVIEKRNKFGIHIDVEIDEPYSGYDKTPIHYVGCGDEFRDKNLANLGWMVIRFSEKQIFEEPYNCVFYIQHLISLIDDEFAINIDGQIPTPDKCWTKIEATLMAAQQYRENLLNHQFGERAKERFIRTKLTSIEEEAFKHIPPINMPTSPQQNIDDSGKSFEQDEKLSFEPIEHIYLYDGRIELTAVSNIVNIFFPVFDSIGKSEGVAQREGLPQGEILEQWDSLGCESQEIGTFLHSQIECYFKNKPISLETHFEYHGKFVTVDKDVSIWKEFDYFKQFLKNNPIHPFRAEWHIYDLDLKIAGTIDLLCRNGHAFDIYDWKRSKNASPDKSVWDTGINGLEHIPDIKFYHYALQQNLYKYILETNYHIQISNMYLVVLHPIYNNYRLLKVPKMDNEVRIMMQYIKSS